MQIPILIVSFLLALGDCFSLNHLDNLQDVSLPTLDEIYPKTLLDQLRDFRRKYHTEDLDLLLLSYEASDERLSDRQYELMEKAIQEVLFLDIFSPSILQASGTSAKELMEQKIRTILEIKPTPSDTFEKSAEEDEKYYTDGLRKLLKEFVPKADTATKRQVYDALFSVAFLEETSPGAFDLLGTTVKEYSEAQVRNILSRTKSRTRRMTVPVVRPFSGRRSSRRGKRMTSPLRASFGGRGNNNGAVRQTLRG